MKQMEVLEYVVPERMKINNFSKSFIRNTLFVVCTIVLVVIIAALIFITFILQQKLANSSDTLFDLSKNMSELSKKELQWSKIVSDLSQNMSGLSQNVSGLSQNMTETLLNLTKNMPEPQIKKFNSFIHSQLYIFGGADSSNMALSSGSRLNSSTGEWISINNMPHAATQMCGAAVGNNIYLFDGLTGKTGDFTRLNAATVYEPSTGIYTSLQTMPESREGCGAAVLDGYVYVAGGALKDSNDPVSSVIRLKILTNHWSAVSSMKTTRRSFQLVELGGRLYAIGGEGVETVEVYDSSSDSWSFVRSTPYSHRSFGAAVHGGKIYVIDWKGFEVYSPDNNQWNTLPMPSYHGTHDFHTLVSMNGKLWVAGGSWNKIGEKWEPVKTVITYDPSTQQWTKQRDMNVARHFHTAFVVNH